MITTTSPVLFISLSRICSCQIWFDHRLSFRWIFLKVSSTSFNWNYYITPINYNLVDSVLVTLHGNQSNSLQPHALVHILEWFWTTTALHWKENCLLFQLHFQLPRAAQRRWLQCPPHCQALRRCEARLTEIFRSCHVPEVQVWQQCHTRGIQC